MTAVNSTNIKREMKKKGPSTGDLTKPSSENKTINNAIYLSMQQSIISKS